MKNSNDTRETGDPYPGLASKKASCSMCKIVLIAAIVLCVASVALVLLELHGAQNSLSGTNMVPSAENTNITMRRLKKALAEQRASTTILIGNTKTK